MLMKERIKMAKDDMEKINVTTGIVAVTATIPVVTFIVLFVFLAFFPMPLHSWSAGIGDKLPHVPPHWL